MGYYTKFDIQVVPKERINNDSFGYGYAYYNVLDCDSDLNLKMGNSLAEINPDYFSEGYGLFHEIGTESMKWYSDDEDMKELSKQYPDYLFILYGDGEDGDDLWMKYFLNGQMQFAPAKITYDKCTLL